MSISCLTSVDKSLTNELDSFEDIPCQKESSSSESESSSSESESESEPESSEKSKRPRISDDIEEGQKVDIVSLLSSSRRDFLVDKNGDQVKLSSLPLSGKYIMVHRFELPVGAIEGNIYWALKHASSKWSNFQLVVVPKITPGIKPQLHRDLFNSFVSSLPSCLAVPLEDSGFEFRKLGLVLDPNGVVLQLSCCLFLIRHGVESFPFNKEWIFTLNNYAFNLSRLRPFPLRKLLRLKDSHSLLNFAATQTVSVSQLSNKLVGLYLCYDCDRQLVDAVNRVYQESRAKNRELEIVLVYIPLSGDPQEYMETVDAMLLDKGISNWWKLPFNDTTFRKLWLLCDEPERDELIIVGPEGRFMELKGADAITLETDHDMYPYSAEALAHHETIRLSRLSLDSLLFPSTHDYLVNQQGNPVHLQDLNLQGKKVLIFIANFDPEESEFDTIVKGMKEWCCYNQQYMDSSSNNTVLVFVPVFSGDLKFTKEDSHPRMSWLWDSTMPWLICPPHHDRQLHIFKHAIPKGLDGHDLSYIVFGDDGRIVSAARPSLSNSSSLLFPDQLYQDVLLYYIDRFNDD